MSRFIKPLTTLVVILFLAGGAGLYTTANDKKDDTYEVTAYFEKGIGLFPKSDVDVLGVPVGTILDVDPVGTRVKVTMEIDKKYKIPADATAQIIPPSLISDRFVQLQPAYTGGPTLEDGDVLDLDRTQIPAELDDTFKQLKKLLDAIQPGEEGDPGALGALIVELDKALEGQTQNLRGTLIQASRLTRTLAGAKGNLSGLLINLDDLFANLATRAGTYGTLNQNFALVLRALAESRGDIEGALGNLADMTNEIGSLVQTHRARLGDDLGLAARVLRKVLKNRASVSESLVWLPVLGEGIAGAYNPDHQDIDVRNNDTARLQCDAIEDLPDSPLKDILLEICEMATEGGGLPVPPPATDGQPAPAPTTAPPLIELPDLKLDCKQGVKKVRKEVSKLEDVGLPPEVQDQVTKPLKKKLKKLAKKCKELGEAIGGKGGLFDDLPGVGDLPDLGPDDDEEELEGSAAGAGAAAPPPSSESPVEGLGNWFRGFLGFLGIGS
jgi:virulence factor Mce-like protein